MHIQNFIKIHPFVPEYIEENTFLHQSRAITLLFMNEFSPFSIPNHSFPISISMQDLKKIGQKLLKFESGNEALTDGRPDGRTLKRFGGYNIIPRHFLWRTIKMCMITYMRGTVKKFVDNLNCLQTI